MTTSTPRITPSCTGPCHQGRRLCPSPQACGISAEPKPGIRAPLPNSAGRWARVLIGFVFCVFAAIGAGALVGFLTKGTP